MGRPLRVEFPGAVYHITNRGNERKNIFLDDADRIKLLKILEDYNNRYGILIHSYIWLSKKTKAWILYLYLSMVLLRISINFILSASFKNILSLKFPLEVT